MPDQRSARLAGTQQPLPAALTLHAPSPDMPQTRLRPPQPYRSPPEAAPAAVHDGGTGGLARGASSRSHGDRPQDRGLEHLHLRLARVEGELAACKAAADRTHTAAMQVQDSGRVMRRYFQMGA